MAKLKFWPILELQVRINKFVIYCKLKTKYICNFVTNFPVVNTNKLVHVIFIRNRFHHLFILKWEWMWLIFCPERMLRIQGSLLILVYFRNYPCEKGLGGISGVLITLLANIKKHQEQGKNPAAANKSELTLAALQSRWCKKNEVSGGEKVLKLLNKKQV